MLHKKTATGVVSPVAAQIQASWKLPRIYPQNPINVNAINEVIVEAASVPLRSLVLRKEINPALREYALQKWAGLIELGFTLEGGRK